jgi:hypothetical protein
MSAFLLPLRYLTLGREGAFDGYASSGYFADGVQRVGGLGASAIGYARKKLARKDRVYQWKSPVITVSHRSQLFFYLQHPIIELLTQHMHYISCIYGGWLL